MTAGSQERRRLEEIHEINRRFLELIAIEANERNYGLPADLCDRIRALGDSQIDIVAGVPLLLVTASRRGVEKAGQVRDMENRHPRTYGKTEVAEQVFTAALMTWLTQDAQQNHSLASLWLGTRRGEGEPVGALSFGDIQNLAPYADIILSARFADRPDVWRDLIRAAESNDSRRQRLARLAMLPHSYPVAKPGRRGSGRRRKE